MRDKSGSKAYIVAFRASAQTTSGFFCYGGLLKSQVHLNATSEILNVSSLFDIGHQMIV